MTARQADHLPPDRVRPYWLGSGQRGVLLLHGFAGTPPEMRQLGETLAANGLTAYGPLLIGHGTSPEDLERTSMRDWIACAGTALDELLQRCPLVGVAGQSMGAGLALHLAATRPEVRAVVSHAGFLRLRDWRVGLLPLGKYLVRWDAEPSTVDLFDQAAIHRLWSYRRRPTRAIDELRKLGRLVAKELPQVRQPLLVMQGQRDTAVDPRQATRILARAGSEVRRLRIFARSGHGISVDIDRDEVAKEGFEWLDRYLV